jgi:hypothetical protein
LRTGAERRINHFVKPTYFAPGRSQRENACGLFSSVTRGRFSAAMDLNVKAFLLQHCGRHPMGHGPGDVIFFKDGAHANWHVEGHVRKLAFLRRTSPVLLGYALRGFSKIKRTVAAARKRTRTTPAAV